MNIEISAEKDSEANEKDNNCEECGRPDYKIEKYSNIPDGQSVDDYKKYPWMVALFVTGNKYKWGNCGGALISSSFVLTAAHCVHKNGEAMQKDGKCEKKMSKECFLHPKQIKIGILGKNKTLPAKKIAISRIIVYSKFQMKPAVHDIALLKLKRPVRCTEYTRPICVPKKDFTKIGDSLIISGFGKTSPESKNSSFELREGTMKKKSKKNCAGKARNIICLSGSAPCDGDSGSAAIFNKKGVFYAIGIISRGNCAPKHEVTFASVSHYYTFIKKYVKNLPKYRNKKKRNFKSSTVNFI